MSTPALGERVPNWALGSLLLAGTISVAGITDYLLTRAGHEMVGTVIWTLSYGAAFAVIWFVWLRHIELTGPESG